MRRPLALFVLIAFVAGITSTALATCRRSGAREECCCPPAPPGVICAPDCCDGAKRSRLTADVTTHLRGLWIIAGPSLPTASLPPDPTPRPSAPVRRALVGLHERAAPRLPLRI